MQIQDWFENWLRSKIADETPLPQPDATWQKIQQRREKRRRRQAFFWFVGGLGIAAATGGAAFFFFQNFEKPEKTTASTTAPAVTDFHKSGSAGDTTAADFSKNESQNVAQRNVVEVMELNDVQKIQPAKTAAATADFQKFQSRKNESPAASGSPFFENKNLKINDLNIKSEPQTAADQAQDFSRTAAKIGSDGTPVRPEMNETSLLPTSLFFLKIPPRETSLDSLPTPDTLRLKMKIHLDWQAKLPFRLSVEASGGYGTNFLLQQTSPLPGWQDLRQQQERPLDAFSATLGLRADVGRRWFASVGLGFWRWTDERRAFGAVRDSSMMLPGQVIKIIKNADGTETQILDTALVIVRSRVDTVGYNRFDRFEVPVAVGARFFTSKKFQLEASAGLAFGFRAPSSGQVAAKNLQSSTPLRRIYLQSGTLAAFGRLNLTRSFGKTTLGLGVQGRWEYRNMALVPRELVEKRASVGLNLSVRRAF